LIRLRILLLLLPVLLELEELLLLLDRLLEDFRRALLELVESDIN
jgi:hypothetical protein